MSETVIALPIEPKLETALTDPRLPRERAKNPAAVSAEPAPFVTETDLKVPRDIGKDSDAGILARAVAHDNMIDAMGGHPHLPKYRDTHVERWVSIGVRKSHWAGYKVEMFQLERDGKMVGEFGERFISE